MRFAFKELKTLALDNAQYRDWYDVAAKSIKKLGKKHKIPFKTLAGVVAITSQNIQLAFNQQLVLEWIENGANIEAARKVRHYKSVQRNLEHFLKTGEVRGPKVSQFYEALRFRYRAVVLDTHMKVPFRVQNWTTGKMKRAKNAIERVASELEWDACQTQAAIWCGVYRQKNPNKPVANYSFQI